MNAVGLPTCRRGASKRPWLVVLLIAMLTSSSSGPGVVQPVQAQAPVGANFVLDAGDLRFIFRQIVIAQNHAAGGQLFGPGLNQVNELRLPFGLRTVDGSFNHLDVDNSNFGRGDQVFPRRTEPSFRTFPAVPLTPPVPASNYVQNGTVIDPRPRIISNLIVDQTATNPAAVAAALRTGESGLPDPNDPSGTIFIPNVAPDVGLSAPFNIMFVFFGQFFDHGLDLLAKSPTNMVVVPLRPDDPLIAGPDGIPGNADDLPANLRFMAINRGQNQPGPDNILGTADDVKEGRNKTTPFVDQNQTYTSHPSHQVFLREYDTSTGRPLPNGRVLDGAGGNIGTWAELKVQAADVLGIQLVDTDVLNVPLLLTDPYGHFRPGPNGFPQMVISLQPLVTVEGNPAANGGLGVLVPTNAMRTGHQFLDDIAHNAVPRPGFAPDGDLTVGDINAVMAPNTYDDELLNAHFCTGDGRGNENIALTAVHTIFHSEHNRLALQIGGAPGAPGLIDTLLTPAEAAAWRAVDPASGWGFGERLFQAARFVTEMQYQHLVFEEFARKVAPSINVFVGDGINFVNGINPAIVAEFAHSVYRFGHSMLTETISRTFEDGTNLDLPLLTGFLNPREFTNPTAADGTSLGVVLNARQAAGAIFQGGARQVANEIDEFKTEALRNNLLGLPLDLAAINLARGRSEGIPTLNEVRRLLYAETGDPILAPYQSWKDFEFGMRNRESVINYLAAYGTHPALLAAATVAEKRAVATMLYLTNDPIMFMLPDQSGLNDVDLWMGGLAEKQSPFGGLLGSTFNAVFEIQLEQLQNADRFYYLERLDGLNLLAQLEGNSFQELIARNTTAGTAFAADVFARPGLVFNLAALGDSGPILDDPSTEVDESTLTDLVRLPDGTFRYLGPEHVIWNGRDATATPDRAVSSEGDDTFRGGNGNDRFEGGSGNDQPIGGEGDDILTDTFGEDVMKGGPGNDAIHGGSGPFDLLQGNEGNDFIVGGNDTSEVFGGPGNDIFYAGVGLSESFGGRGDDWIEGTESPASVLVGDDNNQFQDDPTGGHDVILAGLGDSDFDAEGGDDIMVGTVDPTHRLEGMLGFDWATYRGETKAVDADMLVTGVLLVQPNINELRDRYDLTEGLSGTRFNDLLRGDNRLEADLRNDGLTQIPNGHVLTAAGIARIGGVAALLPPGATEFAGGNIILGGPGSDLLEGRGGNDILDGDAWLNVQLEGTLNDGTIKRVNTLHDLKNDVFANPQRLNPGNIAIVRSIVTGDANAADVDTAVFSANLADYTITNNGDGTITVRMDNLLGSIDDGTDTLRNIERLRFADVEIPVAGGGLTVALAFPDGGERVFAGVPTNVRWTASNALAGTSFSVQLSTNGGNTFAPIAGCQNLGAAARQCAWTPAGPAINNARVRVLASRAGATVQDSSAANFQISTDTPSITVTQPTTGVTAIVSATQNIRWNHNLGANALVRIDISRNGGAFQPITTSFRVTGGAASVFPWVVSGPASANTRVRVTWLDGAVQGTSGIFAVAMPTLTVTAPNGGEIFAVGSTRTIRWTHTIPAGGGVNLDVSRDGGVTWTPIALNVGNTNATTGSFNWVVSGPATATARIRVRWTADAAANDISNANFTIAAPSLTVAQPSGNVGIGSTQNIRVTSNLGPSSVLNLELTRDDGLSWQPVGSGTTNNNGVVSFAWLVESPTTAGAVARIRATWTTNFTVFDESVSFAILNP